MSGDEQASLAKAGLGGEIDSDGEKRRNAFVLRLKEAVLDRKGDGSKCHIGDADTVQSAAVCRRVHG